MKSRYQLITEQPLYLYKRKYYPKVTNKLADGGNAPETCISLKKAIGSKERTELKEMQSFGEIKAWIRRCRIFST